MGIKYKVNESFFNHWSPEMAYVLGYLYADGSLEDASYLRGKYIRVSSIDEDSILRIRSALSSQHTVVKINPTSPNRRIRYFLRIGNKKLYESLVGLGLYPNKSLTARLPEIPRRYIKDFVRGYFDGDGGIYLWRTKGKTRELIVKNLALSFTSGSYKFLEDLEKVLQVALCIPPRKIYLSTRAFQLCYKTADSIKLFKLIYSSKTNLYLRRKFKVFMDYFRLRPQKIDSDVAKIISMFKITLDQSEIHNYGAVAK